MNESREPVVRVGVVSAASEIEIDLRGDFRVDDDLALSSGSYRITSSDGAIEIRRDDQMVARVWGVRAALVPVDRESHFAVKDVRIGIDFHWDRRVDQVLKGEIEIGADAERKLSLVNRIGVEQYLEGVISSEMSETAHEDLLKAHAVISRSWLLAQIESRGKRQVDGAEGTRGREDDADRGAIIRWYDRENHADFDVCADDHCQRYQGIGRARSDRARRAVATTRGEVLVYAGRICDARFSKSCGGMTEEFKAAWEDREIEYLRAVYDGEEWPEGYGRELAREEDARGWILGSPDAFCAPPSGVSGEDAARALLTRILPDFDQETIDYYRWEARLGQEELQDLIRRKLGREPGAILRLEAIERGKSGRIVRLGVLGERERIVVGKELEIRRLLSPTHLYSSAIVIESEGDGSGVPEGFIIRGAGWGHGVGLCQIGAAVMAEKGYDYRRILMHYYRGAGLEGRY